MTNYPRNNKTVSDEIRNEYKSTYQNNVVVVASSLFVRETTQCILPYPPHSYHSVLVTFLATFLTASDGSNAAIANPTRTAVRILVASNCNTKISKALTPKVCHLSLI